jgi:hypothetical protein
LKVVEEVSRFLCFDYAVTETWTPVGGGGASSESGGEAKGKRQGKEKKSKKKRARTAARRGSEGAAASGAGEDGLKDEGEGEGGGEGGGGGGAALLPRFRRTVFRNLEPWDVLVKGRVQISELCVDAYTA